MQGYERGIIDILKLPLKKSLQHFMAHLSSKEPIEEIHSQDFKNKILTISEECEMKKCSFDTG